MYNDVQHEILLIIHTIFLMIVGAASSLADFAAARGRDYTSAANFPGHYPGFLENSRPGQPFGWAPLPSALHSMQGKGK